MAYVLPVLSVDWEVVCIVGSTVQRSVCNVGFTVQRTEECSRVGFIIENYFINYAEIKTSMNIIVLGKRH